MIARLEGKSLLIILIVLYHTAYKIYRPQGQGAGIDDGAEMPFRTGGSYAYFNNYVETREVRLINVPYKAYLCIDGWT